MPAALFSFSKPAASSTAAPTRGYFAFAPGLVLTPEEKLRGLQNGAFDKQDKFDSAVGPEASLSRPDDQPRVAAEPEVDNERAERIATAEKRRRVREERERAEALKGEKHWVHCGGISKSGVAWPGLARSIILFVTHKYWSCMARSE